MGSSSSTKYTKARLWHLYVQELPNATYFLSEERPQDFDHIKYLTSLDPASDDCQDISSRWKEKVVLVLESSNLPELQQAGRRLARE